MTSTQTYRKGSKVAHAEIGIAGRVLGKAIDGYTVEFDDGSVDVFAAWELVKS